MISGSLYSRLSYQSRHSMGCLLSFPQDSSNMDFSHYKQVCICAVADQLSSQIFRNTGGAKDLSLTCAQLSGIKISTGWGDQPQSPAVPPVGLSVHTGAHCTCCIVLNTHIDPKLTLSFPYFSPARMKCSCRNFCSGN